MDRNFHMELKSRKNFINIVWKIVLINDLFDFKNKHLLIFLLSNQNYLFLH
jgi:hypothetical protein